MKQLGILPSVGALVLCLACQPPGDEGPGALEDSVLFTEVRIVRPEDGTLSAPQDILVSEGRILRVMDPGIIDLGSAEEVVPAKGLFVLPGLIDVHAHIGDGGLGPQSEEDREGALAQFVRYGVTTVFVPGGGGGNDDQLKVWKQRCATGELMCPGLYGSGALVTAPGSHPIGTIWDMPADVDPAVVYRRGAVTITEDEAVEPLLDRKVSQNVDAIKIVIEDGPGPWYPKPRLSRAKIEQLTTAAHERGLAVFAHVSLADHVIDGVAAGIDGVMHSSEDEIPDPTLAEMARRGIFYVVTLSLYDGLFDQELGRFEQEPYARSGVSARALASLENQEPGSQEADPAESAEQIAEIEAAIQGNLRRAAAAGVPVALGTDTNNPSVFPGYSAHEELALMVEAGLSPAQALEAATSGGASFLGLEETLGNIAPGFEADLLLLTKNPLEDIRFSRSIHRVVLDGRIHTDVVADTGLF